MADNQRAWGMLKAFAAFIIGMGALWLAYRFFEHSPYAAYASWLASGIGFTVSIGMMRTMHKIRKKWFQHR